MTVFDDIATITDIVKDVAALVKDVSVELGDSLIRRTISIARETFVRYESEHPAADLPSYIEGIMVGLTEGRQMLMEVAEEATRRVKQSTVG